MASYHEVLSKNKSWTIGVGANHLKQINVQDVTIRGNLVVDGSYVYQNVESSIVQDPIMIIGSGPSGEALTSQSTQDRGLAFKYHDGSNEKTGFIGYDINSNKFRFDDDVTIVDNAITSPADPTSPATVVANIDGSLNGQVTTAEQHSITTMVALSSIGSQNNTITAEGNLTVSQGLTVTNGQTFTSNLVDINGGAIDNTIIGGNTPVAGTFTTLTANDQLVVNAGASIIGDTTNEITLNVKGVGSQTANILNIELSDGTDKLTVDKDGVTTLASLVATTADINAGTIDNTVIGGSNPADGTFATLTATTIVGTLSGGAENSNKVKGTSTNGSITRVMGGTVLVDRLSNGTNEGFVDATGYTISREALANSEFLFKAVLHYRCAYEADQRIKFKIIRSKSSSFNSENVTIYEGPYLGPSNAAGPYNGIANIEVYDDFEGSGASSDTTYYYKIQYQLESANSEYETTSASGILGGNTNRNLLMIQEFAN